MEEHCVGGGKKNAEDLGAHVAFIDESGFLLCPSVCRTWGVRGKTPVIRSRFRREKVSVISALTVSPKRHRLNLHFQCLPGANFDNKSVADFLRTLLRNIHGNIIVVWDNGRTHRGDEIRKLLGKTKRLRLVALPPYAPELNPDEGVWNQLKRQVANGNSYNPEELATHITGELVSLASSQSKLRWCFHQSELPFYLA